MSGSNAKVLDLSSHLHAKKHGGWWTGHVRCQVQGCRHQWVETKPGADPPKDTECPKCSAMAGVAIYPDVVEILEAALKNARAGKTRGVILIQETVAHEGTVRLSHVVYDRLQALGALDWAKHSVLHEGDYVKPDDDGDKRGA